MARREKAYNLKGVKKATFNTLFSFNSLYNKLASKLLNSIS